MNKEAVMEQVVEVIRPYASNKDALANVTAQTKILTELEVNSARLVDIIVALEEKFDIEIADEEADEADTVGAVVEAIWTKIEG